MTKREKFDKLQAAGKIHKDVDFDTWNKYHEASEAHKRMKRRPIRKHPHAAKFARLYS